MGRSRGLRSFSSYSLRNVKHLNHCNVARIKVVDSEIKKSVKIRADPDLNQRSGVFPVIRFGVLLKKKRLWRLSSQKKKVVG